MKIKLAAIGFICLVSGCSQKILDPGIYVEKPKKDVIRLVSEEFQFKSGNKFEYTYLSDDLRSSKHGAGNYKIENKKLILEFTNELLKKPKSEVVSKEIQQPDSTHNIYQIQVKDPKGNNLGFANLVFINTNNEVIKATTSGLNGKAEVLIAKESNPLLLKAPYVGFEEVIYELPKNKSLSLEVILAENYSTQITNKRVERRLKIKKDYIVIDGREYQKNTFASKN